MIQNETSLARELIEALSQSFTESGGQFKRSIVGHEADYVLGSLHQSPAVVALPQVLL